MALTNFLMTVVGVGAVVLLVRGDVKHSASNLKKNVRQIQIWPKESSKEIENAKPKELPKKDLPKGD